MGTATNPPNEQNTKKKFWSDYDPIEKITFCNTIFVFLYLTVTIALACIAHNQYSGLKTDERPWIRIWPDQQGPPIEGSFKLPIHVLNSGKTPARSMVIKFSRECVKMTDAPQLNKPPFMEIGTGLEFPNVPGDHQVSYDFNTSELEDFKTGKAALVFYGIATYSDFFGVQHWTKFCIASVGAPNVRLYAPKNCAEYNDIDNN